ncbi:Fic/DOC family protein [Macrococcoides canis]|uniref:Fic/DOC family protein n=1 Tax=Macrococcoides canis TaxID=1855823 RepID=UPI001B8C93E8|nr:Fic family protein [Macrococcus canis]QUR94952.1 hypothetical protein GOY09_08305 [Macrococcus canis]UTH06533.1 Fic family protein [Macrococcus canis]
MDQHFDKTSDILINSFNIVDKEQLKIQEQAIVTDAMEDLLDSSLKVNILSSEDLKDIHRFLFGDIYPWAGEYRTVNIEKPEKVLGGLSVQYGNYNDIEESLNKLMEEAKKKNPGSMSHVNFTDHVRKLTADIWRVHPFREGNTRTAHVLASKYCAQYGYKFNDELVSRDSQYFRNALVLANMYNESHELLADDEKYLKRLFLNAVVTDS